MTVLAEKVPVTLAVLLAPLYRLLKARMLDWGFTPPKRVVLELPVPLQENWLRVIERVILFPAAPAVLAVIVTVPPLDVAVTPRVALLRLIAAARFAAVVVGSPGMTAKFVPVFKPLTPLFPPLRVISVGLFGLLNVKSPPDPPVMAVSVEVFPLACAVTLLLATVPGPKQGFTPLVQSAGFALIAAVRFRAVSL